MVTTPMPNAATTTTTPALAFHPLTPALMDDFGVILRGNFGAGCWCTYPRMRDAELRALPGDGSLSQRKRAAMTARAAADRSPAPGLLAYLDNSPAGWIAIAPRPELRRIHHSRATPPVNDGLIDDGHIDDTAIWVIPCITVRKEMRGQGIAVALIRAAVAYAAANGAPAVEAYPRAGRARTGDDNAYFGTEPMFLRAGFRIIRAPLPNLPRNWTPRVTMRIDAPTSIDAPASIDAEASIDASTIDAARRD